jgi:hypothetical protein
MLNPHSAANAAFTQAEDQSQYITDFGLTGGAPSNADFPPFLAPAEARVRRDGG